MVSVGGFHVVGSLWWGLTLFSICCCLYHGIGVLFPVLISIVAISCPPTTGMLKEVYGKAFKTSKVANQLLEKLIVTAHLDAGGALSVEKFNFDRAKC